VEHNGAMIAPLAALAARARTQPPDTSAARGRTRATPGVWLALALALWTRGALAQDETAPAPSDSAAPAATEGAPPAPAANLPTEGSPQPSGDTPRYGDYPPPDRYAEAPITDPSALEGVAGAREHEGVFVRLQLGPGAARTKYKERVDGVKVSDVQAAGLSGSFDLSVGGRAVSNLIVHGNVTYTRSHAQLRTVDGVKDATLEVNSTALTLGAGALYYFMPYNLFLELDGGPSWLFESRKGSDVRSNTGGFVRGCGGKEWWVGPRSQWAIGVAMRFTFAAAAFEIGGVASTMKYMDLALAMSITFN
jgi:hypothetical protein